VYSYWALYLYHAYCNYTSANRQGQNTASVPCIAYCNYTSANRQGQNTVSVPCILQLHQCQSAGAEHCICTMHIAITPVPAGRAEHCICTMYHNCTRCISFKTMHHSQQEIQLPRCHQDEAGNLLGCYYACNQRRLHHWKKRFNLGVALQRIHRVHTLWSTLNSRLYSRPKCYQILYSRLNYFIPLAFQRWKIGAKHYLGHMPHGHGESFFATLEVGGLGFLV
jgi:hypothetical protein